MSLFIFSTHIYAIFLTVFCFILWQQFLKTSVIMFHFIFCVINCTNFYTNNINSKLFALWFKNDNHSHTMFKIILKECEEFFALSTKIFAQIFQKCTHNFYAYNSSSSESILQGNHWFCENAKYCKLLFLSMIKIKVLANIKYYFLSYFWKQKPFAFNVLQRLFCVENILRKHCNLILLIYIFSHFHKYDPL